MVKDFTKLTTLESIEIQQSMIKSYLPFYALKTLRGPSEYGNKFLIGRHHLEWGDAINCSRRILALAARDHGKSHFYCFAYALWMVHVKEPGRLGYIFSATDQQAKEHLDKIRKELLGGGEHGEANPLLSSLLPLKKDSARTIVFANGSELRARGFGSRVRGGHPFYAIVDDCLDDNVIWSETLRSKSVDYYLSAIEPMVVPGGQIIVVGTPFHAQDLYKSLADTEVYHVLKHPAVVDDKPLWPERYDMNALNIRKRVLGSSLRWSREYLCEPISDDSSLFPSWLFEKEGCKLPYAAGLPGRHWEELGYSVFIGVDLAISASAKADYFVIFVLAVDPKSGDRWIVDIYRDKGMGYQRQVDMIISMSKIYDAQFIFVEANQYQRVISDMVIRTSDVPIKAFYTTGRASRQATTQRRGMSGVYSANKNALDRGIPGLRILLENSKLHIPWDPKTRDKIETWIGEMQSFGFAGGKLRGVGAHDDTVLAFWMADQAARVGGAMQLDFSGPMSDREMRTPDWISQLGKTSYVNDHSAADEIDWFGDNQNTVPGLDYFINQNNNGGGWIN